ncbi:hypothetical protein CJ030_MR7G016772 [Morella rubra]|uniref:Uncharacterized protein n=1 Tax=Morella rubra TaxID=262757 RepID=A0A6A1UZB2_9ROSI|nr:hypothetical protein CJ030_MR7G016772 [Morella rubra]
MVSVPEGALKAGQPEVNGLESPRAVTTTAQDGGGCCWRRDRRSVDPASLSGEKLAASRSTEKSPMELVVATKEHLKRKTQKRKRIQ